MKPRDLAVMLNVSQGQIHRILRESGGFAAPSVGRYQLESWAREMRSAEMYLREYFTTQEPPTSCEDPRPTTPFQQGYRAHDCGQHANANPFNVNTGPHAEWLRGFQKSDRDSRPATE